MADMPPRTNKAAPTAGGNSFTRKLGPLPVWAWAALILVVFYGYERYKKNSSSTGTTADTTGNGTYVPGFDAASGGVQGAYTPGSTYTYNYYGDTAAGQASGGGTSSGGGSGGKSGVTGPNPERNRFPAPPPSGGPSGT